MPELSGRELLNEWRRLMDSLASTAASAAGPAELPKDLLAAMQGQVDLVGELLERERRLQAQLTGRVMAPADAVFDLLEESGATLRRQAQALEAAGKALEETARLMERQAELFEHTIGTLRQPTELVKAVGGVPRAKKGRARPRG